MQDRVRGEVRVHPGQHDKRLQTYVDVFCILYSVFAERLRDGPEVQQVAEGGVHHRQGVQIQGEFHEPCQYLLIQ